jgi:excisionase family DNA binding protein
MNPVLSPRELARAIGVSESSLKRWADDGRIRFSRTAGGHRLYSQHDIDTLKWMVDRQNEGLSISRAMELWRQLESEGQDPLQAMASTQMPAIEISASSPTGDVLKNVRQAWISACMLFDEAQSEQILSQAFAVYPVDTVCFDVLQKGLAEVGEGWYRGEVTVQQEHFISELAIRRMETLIATSAPPVRPGRILVGCPPQEEHVFSTLLLTLLLRRRGWDVVYLGANVPAMRIEPTLDSAKPQLVIMAAQHLSTAATLLEMSQVFQETRMPLAFGGLIFNRVPALREHIPGYFLGEDLQSGVAQVEKWLTTPSPIMPVVEAKQADESYKQAKTHFQEQRGMIEAGVWQELRNSNGLLDLLPNVNGYLARYINAALTLGDMNFLNEDMAWIEELLRHYSLPDTLMQRYLEVYHQVTNNYLDKRGAPIVQWLASFIEKE